MGDVIRFAVKRIGGPFDGAKGLVWLDDGEERALPEQLHVGYCRGDGVCGIAWCSPNHQGGAHLAAWDAERVLTAPVADAAQYVRVDSVVVSYGVGEATYVHAGLDLRPFCETPEFAGVGAGGTWDAMVSAMRERHVQMSRMWSDYLRRLG